jgi:hypothetical protein
MFKNGASEAVHFCIASLAGPATKEKLAKAPRQTEFWLLHIATRAVYPVQIDGNGRFRAV